MTTEGIGRWNFTTREYEPYTFPEPWHTPLWTPDFDQVVNCAECGTQLPYGQCFTSLRIHTPIGLGFGVCGDCYRKERDMREAAGGNPWPGGRIHA